MWTIEEFILPGGRWQWRSQRIVRSMCPSQYPAPGDSSDPRLSCWFSLSKVAFSLMLFNDDCQAIYPRPTAVQLMHWLTSACRFCILYICLFVHLVNSLVCAFLCFLCICVLFGLFCVYSCIWLIFQFSEVETWWERRRQYSSCQPGELFCTDFPEKNNHWWVRGITDLIWLFKFKFLELCWQQQSTWLQSCLSPTTPGARSSMLLAHRFSANKLILSLNLTHFCQRWCHLSRPPFK